MNLYKIKTLYESHEFRPRLFYLLTYKIKNKKIENEIIKYINKTMSSDKIIDDKTIYAELRTLLIKNKFFKNISKNKEKSVIHLKSEKTKSSRGSSIAISAISTLNLENYKPTNYLDIGSFDGDITYEMGKYFGLKKANINGIDIKNYTPAPEISKNMTFKQYNGRDIPYGNNTFDLITCFMVLHHIPAENLNYLLNEISRVMKRGGILIVKEHNSYDKFDNETILHHSYLNVLHEYYDNVLNAKNSTFNWEDISKETNYHSSYYWNSVITKNNGFKLLENKKIKNPFNNYFTSFAKQTS